MDNSIYPDRHLNRSVDNDPDYIIEPHTEEFTWILEVFKFHASSELENIFFTSYFMSKYVLFKSKKVLFAILESGWHPVLVKIIFLNKVYLRIIGPSRVSEM